MKNKKAATALKIFLPAALIIVLIFALFPEKIERRDIFAMDTYISVTQQGGDIDAVISTITDISASLDMYSGVLMESNSSEKIGNDIIFSATEKTLALNERYGNSVDITAGALTKLWGISGENPTVPDKSDIGKALATIGGIQLDGGAVHKNSDTLLDFGSVAKGYACDRVYDILGNSDSDYAIVSMGSSSLLYGRKPDGSDFRIEIKNPDGNDTPLGMIETDGCFISTSGGYERFFTADGKDYCHILDLTTGYPTESDLVSVTVISTGTDGGIKTDFLSTMIFLEGSENIEKHLGADDYKVIAADKNGNVYVSEGLDFTLYENNGYSLCE